MISSRDSTHERKRNEFEIKLSDDMTTSTGKSFTIDVIPDIRYATYVFIRYLRKYSSRIDFEKHGNISCASLLAYMVYMVHAFIFLCDHYDRSINSYYVSTLNVQSFDVIFSLVSNAYVPDIVLQVCDALRPHHVKKRNIHFVPSYAAFVFNYDIQRMVPPSVFLQAHNVLLTTSCTSQKFKEWLISDSLHFDGNTYKVVNFLGGIYQTDDESNPVCHYYKNWFVSSLTCLTTEHSTSSEYSYNVPTVTAEHYNPYVHLLMLEPSNIGETQIFINCLSKLFEDNDDWKAGSILNVALSSGPGIVTHQLQGPQVPTWISKPFNHQSLKNNISKGTFEDFCKSVNFTHPSSRKDNTRTSSNAESRKSTQEHNRLPCNIITSHVNKSYDENISVYVDDEILLIDPYGNGLHICDMYSGTVICNGNIDGISLPLPNVECSLTLNNSRITCFGILLTNIVPEFSSDEVAIFRRAPRERATMPSLALLYHYATIWIPKIGAATPDFSSDEIIRNDRNVESGNVIGCISEAARHESQPNKGILWSSYRHIDGGDRACASNVRMFPTLEGIFGMTGIIGKTLPLHSFLSLS